MTVKVYKLDGTVDDYPNANITWEWDENEEGYDSGWRIYAFDGRHTVSAFVYPRDCTKIEITHEESDKVFEPKPWKNPIPVNRYKVFKEINNERNRQDEKWGEQNWPMQFMPLVVCRREAIEWQKINDRFPQKAWQSILLEEFYEAFAETEPDKQREEMIKVAGVAVQIIEYLDRKLKEKP